MLKSHNVDPAKLEANSTPYEKYRKKIKKILLKNTRVLLYRDRIKLYFDGYQLN